MQRLPLWIGLFCTISASPAMAQPLPHPADPQILSIVEQISADTLLASVTRLTQFHTRHTFSDTTSDSVGVGAAMRWVQAKGADYDNGGQFAWEEFPWSGNFNGNPLTRNVLIARVAGAPNDSARYIIGGHLDSRTANIGDNAGLAPGADDNGSTCAALLELLRLLPDTLAHRLEVMWFTGEEQGLLGSAAYAQHLAQQGSRVDGMLGLDMLGHIVSSSGQVDSMSLRMYAQGPAESLSRGLQRYMKWVGEAYAQQDSFEMRIFAATDRPGRGGDHMSFSAHGYPAVRVMETNEDVAYQHNPNDMPQNLSPTYARRVAMCAYGGLLTMLLAPSRPPAPEVTALVPGESYHVHIPESVSLPENGHFYLGTRDYTHNYFDTIVDLGSSRDYVDSTETLGAVINFSISRSDAGERPSPFSAETSVWISAAGETAAPFPTDDRLSLSPNPFNSEADFVLEVAQPGRTTLDIYDLLGRHVASLLNDSRLPGVYQVPWSPRNLASGIYLARLATAARVRTIKVAYIR